jgi:hypothetical protein
MLTMRLQLLSFHIDEYRVDPLRLFFFPIAQTLLLLGESVAAAHINMIHVKT